MEGLNRPPLQLAIQAVENRHAGEQKSPWEKTESKVITINNNVCLLFVLSQCDSSVLSSTVALYHMNG